MRPIRVALAAVLLPLLGGCSLMDRMMASIEDPTPPGPTRPGNAPVPPFEAEEHAIHLRKPRPPPSPIPPRTFPPQQNASPIGAPSPDRLNAPPPAPVAANLPPVMPGGKAASRTPAKPAAVAPKPDASKPAAPKPVVPVRQAAAPKAAAESGNGLWRAHLASHRSEPAAINEWQELLKSNPQAYGELEPLVTWVDVSGRGSFARLTFGEFASQKEANDACAKLRGPGRYCQAVKD